MDEDSSDEAVPGAPAARVLVVDDHTDIREMLHASLGASGFDVSTAASSADALALLAAEPFDIVLTDLKLEGASGIELCTRVRESAPGVLVLLMTAYGSVEAAVAAIRAGAYDFIVKPVDFDALELALRRAMEHRALRREVQRLRQSLADVQKLDEIVGGSPAMLSLYELISRVAGIEASLLLTGETGTGKGLVARVIHSRSRRASQPFVAINVAALPATLVESELFGHERGAFTDAKAQRPGLFVQAHRGTVFLDEIGTLPLEVQPKLLRAVETRMVRPLGGRREVRFDARLITATNEDLETAVAEGRFREDLFYRLNVIQVHVPPLRLRGNDVLLLAQHWLERVAQHEGKRVVGITSEAAAKLLAYPWPGNVRELHNSIERAVALATYDQLTVDNLPEAVTKYDPNRLVVDLDHPDQMAPMVEVERRYILRVLEATRGNKVEAARVLGFDRRTLYRKLERYGAAGAEQDDEPES